MGDNKHVQGNVLLAPMLLSNTYSLLMELLLVQTRARSQEARLSRPLPALLAETWAGH